MKTTLLLRSSVIKLWLWLMLRMGKKLLLHLMGLLYSLLEVDTMLSFTFHSCVFKGKLMTLKFSTAVLSAYFYCPRLVNHTLLWLLLSIHQLERAKPCTHILFCSLNQIMW
nr:hypothetical protein Iba_chr05cCG6390 [Ipomoea batatas]GME19603.1 hypothetical protein Iba_scaffold23328CG0010 [Ipomoea batatas]